VEQQLFAASAYMSSKTPFLYASQIRPTDQRMPCAQSGFGVHRRIMPWQIGVVHILISGKTAEDLLPQHPNKRVSAIPARARGG
jgi:hypothetical protein